MTEWLGDFHFLRPWFLLLAVIPFLLQRLYHNGNTAVSSWQKVIDPKLLDFLLIKGVANNRKMLMRTALLGLVSAAIIAAGPSWEKIEVPVMQKQNPVVIMLNMSSDMSNDDVKPNRLERAKYKIKDFTDKLTSTQTALGVYSDEPFVIVPFTDDVKILHNLLPTLSLDIMPANGDRLDRAITLGAERIKEAGYNQGNLVIFASDVGQKLNLVLEAAKAAITDGIKVNIIATAAGENEKLRMVAEAGGGKYLDAVNNDRQIDEWAEMINKTNAPIEKGENLSQQWLDNGWYFLFVPLICCLLLFRKGLLIIALFCFIGEAQAGFFTNADQDGLEAFNNKNYAKAEKLFRDENWKAASYYRQGNYAEALRYYTSNNSVEGLYNQGNALAKSGKIKEAIAKYEEVLKIQPQHEDAKFNLEYLKQQQNQSSQQNQQQNQSSQQNKDSESQAQSGEQNNNNDNGQDNNQNNNQNDENKGEENQQQQMNNQQQNGNDNQEQKQDNSPQPQDNDDKSQENNSSGQNDNENNQDKPEQSRGSYDYQQTEDQPQKQGEQNQAGQAEMQEGDEDYDEKVQAKMQRYRDIPEDPGGLLRAFIAEEYRKNRYNEK